jgi:hypothetical protein
VDKKRKNIKSSVLFFLTRPYRSKDFVKPAPILDSPLHPYSLHRNKASIFANIMLFAFIAPAVVLFHATLPTIVYISAIFLGTRLYNYLLFLLPIKLFVDKHSLLAYNLEYLLSSSICFPRLSFFCLVIQDSLFFIDLMISIDFVDDVISYNGCI